MSEQEKTYEQRLSQNSIKFSHSFTDLSIYCLKDAQNSTMAKQSNTL